MRSIKELPCEIIGAILKNLDHLRFLTPALLACRHFHTSYGESSGVEASILRRQVTPALLPYSVALAEASRLPRPLVASSVVGLLDELYSQPTLLSARVPTLPKRLLRNMSRTHDAMHALATDFATKAWTRISPQTASASIVLSPTEYFRFCRAFYRAELFYTLSWFFRKYSPWENEQIGCVSDYLQAKFVEASRDVLAHDVGCGELSVDYLTPGEDNPWRETWVGSWHPRKRSLFVYSLTVADSYDAKNSLLESPLDSMPYRMSLSEALRQVYDADGQMIEEYSEEQLRSMAPRHSDQTEEDTDSGPYQAWRNANAGLTLEESIMMADNSWLRERAYVFWDAHRVSKLQDGFGEDPGYQAAFTEQEYNEMLESFHERSEIWQKGGRGYWSRGDTSRIVWLWPDK
ncbi:hypothetical protein QBC32DRAFT_225409 [Pseudoneurospora amorphoporcata]|uniref:F-box domain-containing protein n=1 Tax=Pseudoneurospora amorphoporcata TaxID=241081 RepID=A0AAN6NL73_9PEZI|nr:hypothetical protein QBC32DRAFT_225409 [Pseudoneurospora amorphoporcata]